MPYKKMVRASAKEEREYLCNTYGSDFCRDFEMWIEYLVSSCNESRVTLDAEFESLLNEEHPRWGYAWKKFADATALDRIKALKAVIAERRPPWEMRAATSRFFVQNRYWIEIIAIYEINRTNQQVVFSQIVWHGDS